MTYGFGTDRNGATQFVTTVRDANGKIKHSYRDVRQLIAAGIGKSDFDLERGLLDAFDQYKVETKAA